MKYLRHLIFGKHALRLSVLHFQIENNHLLIFVNSKLEWSSSLIECPFPDCREWILTHWLYFPQLPGMNPHSLRMLSPIARIVFSDRIVLPRIAGRSLSFVIMLPQILGNGFSDRKVLSLIQGKVSHRLIVLPQIAGNPLSDVKVIDRRLGNGKFICEDCQPEFGMTVLTEWGMCGFVRVWVVREVWLLTWKLVKWEWCFNVLNSNRSPTLSGF